MKKYIFLIMVAVTCINMGVGEETSTVPKPYFTELEDDELSYVASLYENNIVKKVKNLNFSGKTSIENIKKNGEKISRVVDLATTKSLVVTDYSFLHNGKEWALVTQTKNNGEKIEELLFPKNIIISGIGIEGGIKNEKVYGQLNIFTKIEIDSEASKKSQDAAIIGG